MRRSFVRVVLGVLLCGSALHMLARAQEPGEEMGGRAQFAGMQRVTGEVTAVNGATVTAKGQDGATFQIVTTDNTRVMKGRGVAVKVAELKPGDGVMALGNLDAPTKTLHAAMLFATDAAEVQKLRENLGKTYIAGKVTAIDMDNAKMTVMRPDGVSQTIGFDESTSFRRGHGRGGMGFGGGGFGGGAGGGRGGDHAAASEGESITLADVKVGDNVGGQGAIKGGVFVPTVLSVSTPGERRHGGPPAPANAAPPAK